MLFLIFSGIIALVFGILFLCAPRTLRALSEKTNRAILLLDEKFFRLRIGIGVSLVLSSVLVLFVAYYLFKKYGVTIAV